MAAPSWQSSASIEHWGEIWIALGHSALVGRPLAKQLQVNEDTGIGPEVDRLEKPHRGEREHAHDVGSCKLVASEIRGLTKARIHELQHAIKPHLHGSQHRIVCRQARAAYYHEAAHYRLQVAVRK